MVITAVDPIGTNNPSDLYDRTDCAGTDRPQAAILSPPDRKSHDRDAGGGAKVGLG